MKELAIISGKGGPEKTSMAASFTVLPGRVVLADCDVDATDLHLILSPQVKRRSVFRSGHEAVVRRTDCVGCGDCDRMCRFGAVRRLDAGRESPKHAVDPAAWGRELSSSLRRTGSASYLAAPPLLLSRSRSPT